MNWYYCSEDGSTTLGPISEAEMAELAGSGDITPETLVYNEGLKDWQPAVATELKKIFEHAEGDSTTAVSSSEDAEPIKQKSQKKRRHLILSATVLILATTVGGVFLYYFKNKAEVALPENPRKENPLTSFMYTPKDFDLSRIMDEIVGVVMESRAAA